MNLVVRVENDLLCTWKRYFNKEMSTLT